MANLCCKHRPHRPQKLVRVVVRALLCVYKCCWVCFFYVRPHLPVLFWGKGSWRPSGHWLTKNFMNPNHGMLETGFCFCGRILPTPPSFCGFFVPRDDGLAYRTNEPRTRHSLEGRTQAVKYVKCIFSFILEKEPHFLEIAVRTSV